MKNNTRCVPVAKSDKYPEGLVKFDVCFDCPCYDDNIDECNVLDICIDIPDAYHSIHNDCPLFLYDRMREHAPNEIPEPNEDLIIKYRRKGEQPCTVTGFRGKENWYLLSTHRGFGDDIKVISWEYLEKMEKDDE